MRRSILALLFAAAATTVSGQHQPGNGAPLMPWPTLEARAHGRFFVGSGEIAGMAEYSAQYDLDRPTEFYNGVTFGGYYRIHPNVKVGAFYRLQFGARHDDDWIDTGSEWIWRNTMARPEHVVVLDVTPRALLPFLPGESWVFAIKTRYEVTMYQQDTTFYALQSLMVRPGLTYFYVQDREPVFNVSLQYGTYWSINFGEVPWYSHGPYLNFLYHLAPGLQIDASVGAKFIYWDESSDFDIAWPNNTYAVQVYRPFTIDVGVIYQLR